MTKTHTPWLQESIHAILSLFYDQGMSAGQIARDYNRQFEGRELTRNAVIGLTSRHKTDAHRGREKYRQSPARPLYQPTPRPKVKVAAQKTISLTTATTSVPTRAHFTPLVTEKLRQRFLKPRAQVSVPANDIPMPEPLNLDLLTIAERQCRHPSGEDAEGFHLFCGNPVAGAEITGNRRTFYCSYHFNKNAPPATLSTKKARQANERHMLRHYR